MRNADDGKPRMKTVGNETRNDITQSLKQTNDKTDTVNRGTHYLKCKILI